MRYLCFEPDRPRIAVFDFTSCEGCELQLANKEDSLLPFLTSLEVVEFREISSEAGGDYGIAFIEGTISRSDEVARVKAIREKAKTLVALGSCACFGGVSRQKNAYDPAETNREVYGDFHKDTLAVRAVKEVVPVDLEVPGCPVNKEEVERLVQHLMLGIPFSLPAYPVCVECKQRFLVCMYDRRQLCLGPITRAGCNAVCPAGGMGCWGCRGPSASPNYSQFFEIARREGFDNKEVSERLSFFGAFEGVL